MTEAIPPPAPPHPQANYHVKRRDQYLPGSSTLLALFQGGRVLKNPGRPLTDVPEGFKRVVNLGVGNTDSLIQCPDCFSTGHLKMDARRIDSFRKALAVHIIMERIRRKVLGENKRSIQGHQLAELTYSC